MPAWVCGPAQPGPLWAPRAERPPETVWGHAGDCSPAGASILFLVSLSGTTVWGRTLILPRKEVKATAVKLGARPPLRPGFTAPQPPLGETVNQAADGLPAEGALTSRGACVRPHTSLSGGGRGLEGGAWRARLG